MTDNPRVPLDAPLEHGTSRAPLAIKPEPTDAEIAADHPGDAAHALINITEDLARYLRLVTDGALTLAVVQNRGRTLKERQGMGWTDAHEFADRVAGPSSMRSVLLAQAAILRGEGTIGEHMARDIDRVAPRRVRPAGNPS
jgi:hypothetical protein